MSYTILSTSTRIFPGSSNAAIARKIAFISSCEPLRLGIFLPTTILFQGLPAEQALAKAKSETLPATVKSWMVFTAPLYVSLRFMSPENRVPLMSFFGACWNTYMSWLSHRSLPPGGE